MLLPLDNTSEMNVSQILTPLRRAYQKALSQDTGSTQHSQ